MHEVAGSPNSEWKRLTPYALQRHSYTHISARLNTCAPLKDEPPENSRGEPVCHCGDGCLKSNSQPTHCCARKSLHSVPAPSCYLLLEAFVLLTGSLPDSLRVADAAGVLTSCLVHR